MRSPPMGARRAHWRGGYGGEINPIRSPKVGPRAKKRGHLELKKKGSVGRAAMGGTDVCGQRIAGSLSPGGRAQASYRRAPPIPIPPHLAEFYSKSKKIHALKLERPNTMIPGDYTKWRCIGCGLTWRVDFQASAQLHCIELNEIPPECVATWANGGAILKSLKKGKKGRDTT